MDRDDFLRHGVGPLLLGLVDNGGVRQNRFDGGRTVSMVELFHPYLRGSATPVLFAAGESGHAGGTPIIHDRVAGFARFQAHLSMRANNHRRLNKTTVVPTVQVNIAEKQVNIASVDGGA